MQKNKVTKNWLTCKYGANTGRPPIQLNNKQVATRIQNQITNHGRKFPLLIITFLKIKGSNNKTKIELTIKKKPNSLSVTILTQHKKIKDTILAQYAQE
jgi:hypothetical protein